MAFKLLARLLLSGSGTSTLLQVTPSQCATRPRWALPSPPPMAYASVELISATPSAIWPARAVAALGATDQALPFQCMASGAKFERFTCVRPTAQASVGLLALTAARLAVLPGVAGVATCDHAVPSQ